MRDLLLSRQFLAFLIVGTIAAAAHFSVMIALKEGAGWNPVPATLTGFLGGALVSYILNRRHTFSSSNRSHGAAFWRFFTVASVGFGLTLVLGLLLMGQLQIPYILAQVITTGIVLMWNFLANRFWTFRL